MSKEFDYTLSDSQGTLGNELDPKKFDIERYYDYEQYLLENNQSFWNASEGILVYRRFRSPGVFAYDSRDMKKSLALQLGLLQQSMEYAGDIANFLEPWYGIGVTASAFGIEYDWKEGNAPAIHPPFKSIDEALAREIVPVHETPIGKHILNMIDYFLESTRGKIPISPTDSQASLNAASFLFPTDTFFMDMIMNPDALKKLLAVITDLTIEFTQKQKELIGDAMVLPGHGFPSSRVFNGLGLSSDVSVMISPDQYVEFEYPAMQHIGEAFGGAVFHSCGNWSSKATTIRDIPGLKVIDAAFSAQTDPDPNPCAPFRDTFTGTGVIVNARIVGDLETLKEKISELWAPGIKLIVTSYCETRKEQLALYEFVETLRGGQ